MPTNDLNEKINCQDIRSLRSPTSKPINLATLFILFPRKNELKKYMYFLNLKITLLEIQASAHSMLKQSSTEFQNKQNLILTVKFSTSNELVGF